MANLILHSLFFFVFFDNNEFIRWSVRGVDFIIALIYHSNESLIALWPSIQ